MVVTFRSLLSTFTDENFNTSYRKRQTKAMSKEADLMLAIYQEDLLFEGEYLGNDSEADKEKSGSDSDVSIQVVEVTDQFSRPALSDPAQSIIKEEKQPAELHKRNFEEASEQQEETVFPQQNKLLKRVKFSPIAEQVEYEIVSPLSSPEHINRVDNSDDDSSVPVTSEDEFDQSVGSDPEDMESGEFFNYIQREQTRAEKEREYLMHTLKTKSRVGSIFFDKLKRVLAVIERP